MTSPAPAVLGAVCGALAGVLGKGAVRLANREGNQRPRLVRPERNQEAECRAGSSGSWSPERTKMVSNAMAGWDWVLKLTLSWMLCFEIAAVPRVGLIARKLKE